MEKNKKRIEQLSAHLAAFPQDDFAKYAIAMEWGNMENWENARLHFEELLANNPNYVGAYYHLGRVLEELGEDDTAEAVYKKGITIATQQGNTHAAGELRGALDMLMM